ncbi:hypothetical protein KY465_08630 [Pseudohoeflea sp. DP4N28-3]|uniref:Flagellar protein FlgN n=1 Tax=Pseudohoeflea coraliihabitans TaxID=2860393 RepID=A0ABS6WN12_9HYPH|nr:hypothetical protein [Pseudohoeflea sp. DP4N28-3]
MRTASAPPPHDGRLSALLTRLESVLDNENERIGRDATLDLEQSNALKSRCLYDMAMLMRDGRTAALQRSHARQLAAIRQKLEHNRKRVEAHMEAVRQVTTLLKDVATAADADGTYTADQFMGYEF